MCGIAGFLRNASLSENDTILIKRMTDSIAHRGPDAEGHWKDNSVVLGHRRLSIIDPTAEGNQPMESADGRYVIVYNGEIYNYRELRSELENANIRFKTHTDTEVIMESYRVYGENCFSRFNGMWALAIYDRSERKILLSRDRFGIKPLYYIDSNIFVFASEIKAILKAFPEYCKPNDTFIARYLNGGVYEDYDELTCYEKVKVFPPSSTCEIDLETLNKSWNKYWEFDEIKFYNKWIKGKNPYTTFRKLFEESIELRIRADTEVGTCLSGGLDSSAIAGCASSKYSHKMNTFSSIYEDEDCNEEFYIKKVNEKWDAIPHYMEPDRYQKDLPKYIKDIIWHHDQPTAGSSLYSGYMVMMKVSGNVKVILDGQGADELFAGYMPYSPYIEDVLSDGGVLSKLKAIWLLTILKKEWPQVLSSIDSDTLVRAVGMRHRQKFENKDMTKSMRAKRTYKLFTDDFKAKLSEQEKCNDYKTSSHLGDNLCNDVLLYSIPTILHNVDGNSMAFSIESRVPFLDYRIVEFALALNGKYKIRNQWTKWIVRKALKEYLPKEVIKRKNKMGFPAPFARWLREAECKDEFREKIYSFGRRNIIPPETIDAYYKEHMEGKIDHNKILYRIYNMEVWYDLLKTEFAYEG